ncbi:MAG: sugar transferase [Methylobacteriaceae bacterium]|nr:sugar transferase [Methylobacteriaceae bacterium]
MGDAADVRRTPWLARASQDKLVLGVGDLVVYISGAKDANRSWSPQGVPFAQEQQASALPFDLSRVLDIALAIGALIFLSPVMMIVAAAIKIEDGGPIFFGHNRIGYQGRSFRCWKFRSMVIDSEARLGELLATDPKARSEWEADQKLRRDPRITKLGRLIRVTSIDELPQLFNVLAGEMSLVGPRPIVVAEIERYGRWFRNYCAVRPGVTGIWQISGRNDVSYRKRVAMDVLYSRSRSLSLYMALILATIPAVLRRQGSY